MTIQARGARGGSTRQVDDDAKTPGPTRTTVPVPSARGFNAQLLGVSLWDLVQMECLARSHAAVQVVGDGGIGYLYFDRGHIIHAATADRVGESAALEILGWSNGSFRACDRAWPEAPTIFTSHEALILQVAKRRDESNISNLVAFPGRNAESRAAGEASAESEDVELIELNEEGGADMSGTKTIEERVPPPSGASAANGAGGERPATPTTAERAVERVPERTTDRTEIGGDFSAVLRLGANGAIITKRGTSEEFAETVAYAHRLLQLAGDLLGLEEFVAVECGFGQGRCLIFNEEGGEIVALRPRAEANLQALRERLGL